jgi:hypothetical protein
MTSDPPLGRPVDWSPARRPGRAELIGSRVTLRPLRVEDAEALHAVSTAAARNRDTAWHSIIAEEWPAIRRAFEAWLDASNFDEAGVQRRPLQVPISSTSSATDSTTRDGR